MSCCVLVKIPETTSPGPVLVRAVPGLGAVCGTSIPQCSQSGPGPQQLPPPSPCCQGSNQHPVTPWSP